MEVFKIEGNNAEAKPDAEAEQLGVKEPARKGGIGGVIKALVLAIIVAGITAGVVYQWSGQNYVSQIKEKDGEITQKKVEIKDLKNTVRSLEAASAAGTAPAADTGGELICLTCHGIDHTKGFHDVGTIKLLGEKKGQTPRICTTCHGSSPHNVHKKKTDSGEMSCEDCHVNPEGDFITPQVPEGKTLVCEACHAFSQKPEDVGNYVSIHIVEGNRDCDICHMGDPIKIHKMATEKLGVIE